MSDTHADGKSGKSPKRAPSNSDYHTTDDEADRGSPAQGHDQSGGGAHHSQQRSASATKFPPIALVSYPPRVSGLQVADFLDPSKPLVKSTRALTKPKGPTFAERQEVEERRSRRTEVKLHNNDVTSHINTQRNNERKYLKAQYEFEREKRLAERAIYHRERCSQWGHKLGVSPLAVDLVADNERIEEENYIREREETRRRLREEQKKRRIKNEIIVKALAEVPLLEEARRQKREMLDEERRSRALRDVQRVEAVQDRISKCNDQMEQERRAKLDQRLMGSRRA